MAAQYSVRCVRATGVAPTRTFTDNSNGTITDDLSGLIWQSTDSMVPTTQSGAATDCSALTIGSLTSGWRLPTASELATLVDVTKSTNPVLASQFSWFFGGRTWTSSAVVADTNYWVVDFTDGSTVGVDPASDATYRCIHD